MIVIHAYVMGKTGAIEKIYDFLRDDGQDSFTGTDITIPYDEEAQYPLTEYDAIAILSNKDIRGDH